MLKLERCRDRATGRSGAQGVSLEVQPGRDRLPARRQRLGQVHHDEDDPRAGAAAAPARVEFEGERIDRLRDRGDRPARHRAGAGGAPHLRAHDGLGEPRHGRLHRRGAPPAELDADLERVYALFPRLQGARRAARRHHVGRRAADAGDRPGADGAAAAAADGRAVDGPGAGAASTRCSTSSRPSTGRARPILVVEQNAAVALSHRPSRLRPAERAHRRRTTRAAALLEADDIRRAYLGEE